MLYLILDDMGESHTVVGTQAGGCEYVPTTSEYFDGGCHPLVGYQ